MSTFNLASLLTDDHIEAPKAGSTSHMIVYGSHGGYNDADVSLWGMSSQQLSQSRAAEDVCGLFNTSQLSQEVIPDTTAGSMRGIVLVGTITSEMLKAFPVTKENTQRTLKRKMENQNPVPFTSVKSSVLSLLGTAKCPVPLEGLCLQPARFPAVWGSVLCFPHNTSLPTKQLLGALSPDHTMRQICCSLDVHFRRVPFASAFGKTQSSWYRPVNLFSCPANLLVLLPAWKRQSVEDIASADCFLLPSGTNPMDFISKMVLCLYAQIDTDDGSIVMHDSLGDELPCIPVFIPGTAMFDNPSPHSTIFDYVRTVRNNNPTSRFPSTPDSSTSTRFTSSDSASLVYHSKQVWDAPITLALHIPSEQDLIHFHNHTCHVVASHDWTTLVEGFLAPKQSSLVLHMVSLVHAAVAQSLSSTHDQSAGQSLTSARELITITVPPKHTISPIYLTFHIPVARPDVFGTALCHAVWRTIATDSCLAHLSQNSALHLYSSSGMVVLPSGGLPSIFTVNVASGTCHGATSCIKDLGVPPILCDYSPARGERLHPLLQKAPGVSTASFLTPFGSHQFVYPKSGGFLIKHPTPMERHAFHSSGRVQDSKQYLRTELIAVDRTVTRLIDRRSPFVSKKGKLCVEAPLASSNPLLFDAVCNSKKLIFQTLLTWVSVAGKEWDVAVVDSVLHCMKHAVDLGLLQLLRPVLGAKSVIIPVVTARNNLETCSLESVLQETETSGDDKDEEESTSSKPNYFNIAQMTPSIDAIRSGAPVPSENLGETLQQFIQNSRHLQQSPVAPPTLPSAATTSLAAEFMRANQNHAVVTTAMPSLSSSGSPLFLDTMSFVVSPLTRNAIERMNNCGEAIRIEECLQAVDDDEHMIRSPVCRVLLLELPINDESAPARLACSLIPSDWVSDAESFDAKHWSDLMHAQLDAGYPVNVSHPTLPSVLSIRKLIPRSTLALPARMREYNGVVMPGPMSDSDAQKLAEMPMY